VALTFGTQTAPNNITTYLDSVFATSLANYRKTLIDNIGATNAILYDLIKGESYEEADGGTYIAEELMYGLAPADSYDGYDDLSTQPTDGITQAQFEWRQIASPIAYNTKEVIQNQHRIVNLVKARIQQSELGIQENWAQAFLWGAGSGAMTIPRTSPVNGSYHVEPLPKLISYNTAGNDTIGNAAATGTALTVGGIPESSNSWWQNHWGVSAATTYSGFMYELESMYNTTSLGTGGPPTHMLVDQQTYQNFIHAYFAVYKANADMIDNDYPFIGKRYLNAKLIMDDKVPDVANNKPGTQTGGVVSPSTLSKGTAYYINAKFFKIRYHPSRNWEMLKDENGNTFAKPINGDSRVGHVGWMGNVTINNRRKHGVIGNLARTYSS
jgi:hypothetical protein